MPRTRIVATVLCLVLAALMPAVATQADEAKPSFSFNLLSVEGLVIGKTITIDKAFGAEHNLPVAAPFSFVVPLSPSKEYEVFVDPAPKPGEAWIKINFATADRQLIENIQFVSMRVPMGELQARLQAVAGVLVKGGLTAVIKDKANAGRDTVRATKIGDYDAVEVVGHYDDPELGAMVVRLVGIPNPDGADGVAAIANIVVSRMPVKTVDDLARTRGGALLANFKYLKP